MGPRRRCPSARGSDPNGVPCGLARRQKQTQGLTVRTTKFSSAALALSGLGLYGCSGGHSGPSCPAFDYTKYTPASTTLTLKNDIQPIFAASCAIGMSCHVSPNFAGSQPQAGLGLGPPTSMPPDAAALAAILTALAASSTEAPGSKRVSPAAPEKSFLMVKIEADPTTCNAECTAGSSGVCGSRMPFGQPPLSDANIGKIRDWIKSGAP
jgi:hypothetical protein